MNLASILLVGLIGAAFAVAVRYSVKNRNSCAECGGSCSGSCPACRDLEQDKTEMMERLGLAPDDGRAGE